MRRVLKLPQFNLKYSLFYLSQFYLTMVKEPKKWTKQKFQYLNYNIVFTKT